MRALILRLRHEVTGLPARLRSRRLGLIAVPHVLALAAMLATESSITAMAAFLLAWGIFNFVAIALTQRPLFSGLVSLTLMTMLVLLSQLKYHVLMMTANFVDLMIVDTDTVSFSVHDFPGSQNNRGAERRGAGASPHIAPGALIGSACAGVLRHFRQWVVSPDLSRSKRIFRLRRSRRFTAAIWYPRSRGPGSTPLPN